MTDTSNGVTSKSEDMSHVMISYNWGAQERMLKLRDELTGAGYKVWMDVDNMEDNMDDRMAEAVEKASAILMCFSEKYQRSLSCKKEAQYARDQDKLIIPMKYEDYKPTGWPGLMINPMLYYDVRTDDAMMASLPSIMKRLEKRNTSLLRQDGKLVEPSPSKHVDFVQKIASKLKRYYLDNQCKKQLYPWTKKGGHVDLETLFVPVTIDIPIPGPTPIKERLDSYLDIFSEQQEHTRYCIFAKPGQGKSTLCVKLAYDWCQKKALQHIQLLFILQLGLIKKGTTIEEAICSQLKLKDIDPSELGRVIRDLGDEVVILFDSLDEAPRDLLEDSDDDVTGSVVEIIKRNAMEECRVLVTTRPWRTDISDIAAYKRLELQPFKKADIVAYVKKFFGQNNDPMAIKLGKGLVKVINENKLLIDVSTPLMALLICWYWMETKGRGIPDRLWELYDAVVKIMHKSNRRPNNKDAVINQLGKLAVEGLTPTDTTLVFTEDEVKGHCDAIDQACAMGIIRGDRTLEGANTLQFFHKSAQEFCAGRYLSNQIDELSTYLEEIETIEDALSVALVLIFSSSQKSAAKLIMEKLMDVFRDEIQPELSKYKDEKLLFEEIRPMQAFTELCLECNYEADAEADFASIMKDLYADGAVLFYGIPPKAAITLAYYIKHCRPTISNVALRPIAHASEPPMFYGPPADMYNAAIHSMTALSDKEIQERHDQFKSVNKDLHESWEWERRGAAELAAYIMSIQACEGLLCSSETDVSPIIDSFKYIELQTLNLANFKLDFDSLLKTLEDDCLHSMKTLRVQTAASTRKQMTRLVASLGKMPKLDTLNLSKNPAEAGLTIPKLAETITSCKSLRSLSICDMQIPANDMAILAPKLPSALKILYLRGNEMDDNLASCLIETLPRTLVRLYIDVNNLKLETHNELLQAIQTRCTLLRVLGVYCSPYATDLVKHLGQALQTWDDIYKLFLSSSSKESIPRDCFQVFVKGVQSGNVNTMHMQGVSLHKEDFEELIEVGRKKPFDTLRFSRARLPDGVSVQDYDFVTLVD